MASPLRTRPPVDEQREEIGCADVALTVEVQITERGHRGAEEIVTIKPSRESALGVADLLVRQHPAGLNLRPQRRFHLSRFH